MNRTLIALGTAAVLTAGMTGAAFAADRYASPSQPVPYSQLNTYMKGSASKRAAILAQNTDASTAASAGVNSSATTPAPDATAPATATPDTSAAPVNEPGATTPTPAPAPSAAPAGPAPMPSATNPPATPATPPTPQ